MKPEKSEQSFTRGNVTVTVNTTGCWIDMWGDEGETQDMALMENELLLLYIALGDYFEKKSAVTNGCSSVTKP